MAAHEVPDALDHQILAQLREDARRSFRQIARRIGSTTPTVAARVRRMEETGLIAGYTVVARGVGPPGRPSPWSCVACRGPIRGRARTRRLGGRHHAFCCRGCETRFADRFEKATRDLADV